MQSNLTVLPNLYLNPNTSLAFLPPAAASQLEASRYLSVASLAAFCWDLLCSSGQDYRLLTQYTFNLPIFAYFLSRVASLAHIVSTTVFHAVPVASCHVLPIVIGCSWAVAIPSTSLLFFYRVRAVFDGKRSVTIFFGILWFATLAGAITVPFALTGGPIATTNRCIPTAVKPFSSASIIASAGNDTLVFIAISWRIIRRTTTKARFRSFFGGRNLPCLSRELLLGGQQYYLLTVGGNIFIMAMILSPATPPLLKDMFPVINMALENSMACRVFRDIKLRGSRDCSIGKSATDNTVTNSDIHQALRTFGGTEFRPMPAPMVEITKTIENFNDREVIHTSSSNLKRSDDEYV